MAVIIEYELPADEFALHETLTAVPNVDCEIERVVANGSDQITPYVWVRADDFDVFERAVAADPTVEAATVLSDADDERAYQMVWTGSVDVIVHLLTEQDGTITHAETRNDTWHLRVVFPDRETLSRAHDYANERGFTLTVDTIYRMDDKQRAQFGLTEGQYELLTAGVETGYFEVPRELTQAELAEQTGISHQALSERLRRGMKTLIEHTLVTDESVDQHTV